jgi:protein subunit release factor B
MKKPWFSITLKDCRVDTFRAGGKGGQNQNKVESGVRITHEPSGAVGEARDSRDQLHNKRAAFKRMAESKQFQFWLKQEIFRRQGLPTVDQIVDEWMKEINLKIEFGG